jgi:urate oxidase
VFVCVDFLFSPSGTGDRILSTKIKCEWVFGNFNFDRTDFNGIYNTVMAVTMRVFAGPPSTGVYSASVQQTIYDIGVEVLKTVQELQSISFELPNIHYYPVNFKEYNTPLTNNGEVFLTFDGAAGNIRATIERKPSPKL